jgi:ribosome-binding factor A
VSVTNDFKYATAYVSVLGSDDDKKNAILGLTSASGYIRSELGRRVQLRYTPNILFKLDESIEKGVYLTKLINDTMK